MIRIIGLGGTTKPNSSTELALRVALDAAQNLGAKIEMFDGEFLTHLPHYGTEQACGSELAQMFLDAVREADGIIIASPGYHGSLSGLVKNAIDYLEDTAGDERPYLDGRPVGLVATAYGWQAAGNTLATLRSISHALRGWPTPMGVMLRGGSDAFERNRCRDQQTQNQLETVAQQVMYLATKLSEK